MDAVDIFVGDLKAISLVRDSSGDPNYQERKNYKKGARVVRKVLEVTFKDDKVIVGSSQRYDLDKPGFFISPADPKGNNPGSLVVSQAVSKVLSFQGLLEG